MDAAPPESDVLADVALFIESDGYKFPKDANRASLASSVAWVVACAPVHQGDHGEANAAPVDHPLAVRLTSPSSGEDLVAAVWMAWATRELDLRIRVCARALDAVGTAIMALDVRGGRRTVVYRNRLYLDLYGANQGDSATEAANCPFAQPEQEEARRLSRAIESLEAACEGVYLRHSDGSVGAAMVTVLPMTDPAGTVAHVLVLVAALGDPAFDEQREAEDADRRAFTLRASGIAHDLNNLLMVVDMTCERIAERMESARGVDELQRVKATLAGARELCTQLLEMGRTAACRTEAPRADLTAAIREFAPVLAAQAAPMCQLSLHLPDVPIRVEMPAVAIRQVVANLVSNAVQAMPAGGRVTVTVERSSEAQATGDNAPAHAVIAVHDEGHGVPPELRSSVFKLFFTTKEPGAGSGVGLAAIKALIENAGGSLSFDSSVGVGSTFVVKLPLTAER
jgi:signal transduction histidine kinase